MDRLEYMVMEGQGGPSSAPSMGFSESVAIRARLQTLEEQMQQVRGWQLGVQKGRQVARQGPREGPALSPACTSNIV